VLGLPERVRACLFDLDGVLTRTAEVHAAAWKETFDAFLQTWASEHRQPFVPFDIVTDYSQYVDGKTRADGVRSFLASRQISLPEGTPDDPSSAPTVNGVGNRKNELLLQRIQAHGVRAYEGSVRYVEAVRDAGLPRAVVSSSANTAAVLQAAGLADFFEIRIDGLVVARDGLHGKPAPDTYLAGARALHVEPSEAAVYEDALAGVEAGRAGAFGFVVGVDREHQADALRQHGADTVVSDLAELLDPR
jgi:beta-phosphoglucomutase family hydrolase